MNYGSISGSCETQRLTPPQAPPETHMTIIEVNNELYRLHEKLLKLQHFAEAMLTSMRGSRPDEAIGKEQEPSSIRHALTINVGRLSTDVTRVQNYFEEVDNLFGTGFAGIQTKPTKG